VVKDGGTLLTLRELSRWLDQALALVAGDLR
jgi:hypothetical protein